MARTKTNSSHLKKPTTILPHTAPANPPEKMTVDNALEKDAVNHRLLVESWLRQGIEVYVYMPMGNIPKSAKIDFGFMTKTGVDYIKGSLEARDALYKALRKKSWPIENHILVTARLNEAPPNEFMNLYHAPKKSFVPCYLVGMIVEEKKTK